MNVSRSESFLFGSPGTGWQQQGRINLAIRTYRERTLKDMRDVLDEMEAVMNNRCKQWKVLDCMRKKLEIYCQVELEQELRFKERHYFESQPRDEVRRGMFPVILKLESLGMLRFMDYVYETFCAISRIMHKEMIRLREIIENTGLKFNETVDDMLGDAYELITKFQTFISLATAGSGRVSWRDFWEIFKSTHTKIRQLAATINATRSPDQLEEFLGLTLLDYGIYIPIIKRPVVPLTNTFLRPTVPSSNTYPVIERPVVPMSRTIVRPNITTPANPVIQRPVVPDLGSIVRPTITTSTPAQPRITVTQRSSRPNVLSISRLPTPPSGPSVRLRTTPPSGPSVRLRTTPTSGPSVRLRTTPPSGPSVRPRTTPPSGPSVRLRTTSPGISFIPMQPRTQPSPIVVTRGRGLGPSGITQKLGQPVSASRPQFIPQSTVVRTPTPTTMGPAAIRLSLPPEMRRGLTPRWAKRI